MEQNTTNLYRFIVTCVFALYGMFAFNFYLPDFYDLILLVGLKIPDYIFNLGATFLIHGFIGFIIGLIIFRRND